jgi:hypothetical protein
VAVTSARLNGDGSTGNSGVLFHDLRGGGGTIAFTSSRFDTAKETTSAWLLLARRGDSCPAGGQAPKARFLCRSLARGEGVTAAVDAGRVLTVAPGGVVHLRATSGKLLRTWNLGAEIVVAALRGRTLAVQVGTSVVLYDTATGAKIRARMLAPGEARPPVLLDVQGDLAAYASGGAIHLLRFSDGRDLALALPRAAPPLGARLQPSGLFVLWNSTDDSRPGRLTFISLRTLTRAVAARAG